MASPRFRMAECTALPEDLAKRFWARVSVGDTRDCWPWLSTIQSTGYGSISYKYTQLRAHRVAYMLHYGTNPGDLLVCHTCDYRACCNPHHMFLGTTADNTTDCVQKLRHSYGERQWKAKLDRDIIRELRKIERPNISKLARQFGVARSTIKFALDGRSWAWVN